MVHIPHVMPVTEGPVPEKMVDHDNGSPDYKADVEAGVTESVDETQVLHRELKSRHMQMIAIGGSIGAGLFVSSGGSLSTGGPGSLVSRRKSRLVNVIQPLI